MKAQNQWFYLYFCQGLQVMVHCGFYVPTTTHFMPHTVRKIHIVKSEEELIQFTTYCANSYPAILRNAIIVARPLFD
jgi:hypothetical protein